MAVTLRLLVAAWILVTLARAARSAWQQRSLLVSIWTRIRFRHIAGAMLLLVAVSLLAWGLLWVPPMRLGLGNLVGFSGNAVFTPLEEAVSRAPAPAPGGPDWPVIVLSSLFLGPLLLILPWLAFVEEEIFRAGLERESALGQGWRALVFGLAHLIMLVPVAAALAIGAAGLVYGRLYLRAWRRSDGTDLPRTVLSAFRPTKRSRAAADAAREERAARLESGDAAADSSVALWLSTDRTPERRQAAGVLASTVVHTTFNSMIVVLVWTAIVLDAFSA